MNIVGVIQARMGSKRLPGKVLLDLKGKPVLYHIIERVRESQLINKVVVATSWDNKDEPIRLFCEQNNVEFVTGPECDVLWRFQKVIKKYDPDVVVRITADEPFIDASIIDKAITLHVKYDYDLTTTRLIKSLNDIERTFPEGLDVDVIKPKHLLITTKDIGEREHVCLHIFKDKEKYTIGVLNAQGLYKQPTMRFLLDNKADYESLKKIYNLFYDGKPINVEDVILYFKRPKVSVVILSYNNFDDTHKCVQSFLNQEYKDYELILVDNHSSDDSWVKLFEIYKDYHKINYVRNFINAGYTGGNNFGVLYTKGEYVLIANNDTEAPPNLIKLLVNGLEENPYVAAISALEYRPLQPGHPINFKEYWHTQSLVQQEALVKRKHVNFETTYVDTGSIDGCCFIYRKKLVQPPFPEDYFIYAEDTYLGWMLKLKGYTTKLCTKAVITHWHNTSKKNSKNKRRFIYLGERNKWINFLILYEKKNIKKIFPLMIATSFLSVLSQPLFVFQRLHAWFWLLFNIKNIRLKRSLVQSQRKINDEEYTLFWSGSIIMEEKFYGFTRLFIKCLNKLSILYCKITKLKVLETT